MKKLLTRTVAGRKYENVAGKWVHTITDRHTIVVDRVEDGWEATEIRASKNGTIIDGTKRIIKRSVKAPTMWEAANKLDYIIKRYPEITL